MDVNISNSQEEKTKELRAIEISEKDREYSNIEKVKSVSLRHEEGEKKGEYKIINIEEEKEIEKE